MIIAHIGVWGNRSFLLRGGLSFFFIRLVFEEMPADRMQDIKKRQHARHLQGICEPLGVANMESLW